MSFQDCCRSSFRSGNATIRGDGATNMECYLAPGMFDPVSGGQARAGQMWQAASSLTATHATNQAARHQQSGRRGPERT